MAKRKRLCMIPSMTLGPCDLEYGHDGDMHSSCGDGFYARAYEADHALAQSERDTPPPSPSATGREGK